MADLILIKTGVLGGRAEMPKLQYDVDKGSELGFQGEEEALYIGTKNGNVRLCAAGDIADINAKIDAINGDIENIIARLDALENTGE